MWYTLLSELETSNIKFKENLINNFEEKSSGIFLQKKNH